MLKIRLQRIGRVHEPSFRLVLTESKNGTKSGRFKEVLGSYDPRKLTDALDTERIRYWLSKGANPTATVHNLLVKHQVIDAKKIHVAAKSKKPPVEPAAEPAAESVPESTPAPEEKQENAIVEEAPTAEEAAEAPTESAA